MPHTTFDSFGLPAKLTHALTRIKFTTPTPIQEQAIPLALEGRDILGSAQTGTGKTGAFGIPLIAGMMDDENACALIMTPTRELAGQIVAALEPMIPVPSIRAALLIGGDSMRKQLNQLERRPRLIVGTPGRINDHLERGSLKLDKVRFLVLDETDRMLDMGFGIQIERILKHVPSERQTLLFSATMPSNINKLSAKYMRDPIRIAVGSASTPALKIKQEVLHVTDAEKYSKLIEQLEARKGSVIVFAKTKWGTQKLSDRLNKDGHRSDAIHGDLQQRRRDRVILNFRDERYRILVATDVAARGLDIPHIAHVINYDIPQAPEDYIHRIGRTARAGAEGEAISFVTSADGAKWRAIQRLIKGDAANDGAPSGEGRARRNGPRDRKPFWKRGGDNKPRTDRPYDRAQRTHASEEPQREKAFEPRRFHADKPQDERKSEGRYHSDKPHDRPQKAYAGERPQRERAFEPRRPHADKPRDERMGEDRFRGDKPFDRKQKTHAGEAPSRERAFEQRRTHADKPRDERANEHRPRSDKPHNGKPFKAKHTWSGKKFVQKTASNAV